MSVENGELIVRPHEGQKKVLLNDSRFILMLAGTQGGKTVTGPIWLHREIERCGPGDYLAVTSNYGLFKLKMLPVMLEWFVDILGVGRYWRGAGILELAHPVYGFMAKNVDDHMYVRIILRSAAASSGLESSTAKAVWLDECGQDDFKLESWEAINRRLSLNRGRILGTTTVYNSGWLKSEFYDRWLAGDRDYFVVQFPSIMNPSFPVDEYNDAMRRLPYWKFAMFYRGEFAKAAGMIYDCWDTNVHVVPPRNLSNGDFRLYGGLDFGGVNMAAVLVAHDVDNDIFYVINEYLAGEKSIREHVQALSAWNAITFVGGSKSEEQWRSEFTVSGLGVVSPPLSDVEVGIDRVYELIKTRKLFVFRNCIGLIDEFGRYSRKLDEFGNPTDVIKDKNDFHRLDALRYVISYLRGDVWLTA